MLNRRKFAGLLCAGAALPLGGCGTTASYRYKLTLSLDTPDGVKTGFNVVEIDYWTVVIPARGEASRARGQGIFIGLGSGRRPLVVLLTHNRRAHESGYEAIWQGTSPTGIVAKKCLNVTSADKWSDVASRFRICRGVYSLTTAELPDLVTFSDLNDPKSLMLVAPNNLIATLGPGISWRSMTIQIVDEPLTKGIDEHLPWVRNHKGDWDLDQNIFYI